MPNSLVKTPQTMAVLGAGTWGLSLACLLHGKGIPLVVWDAFPDHMARIAEARKHPKLPQLAIPPDLRFTADFAEAARAEGLVLTTSTDGARAVCELLKAARPDWTRQFLVICAKGIEPESLEVMTQVAEEVLGEAARPALGVLSGPSHAEEVSVGMPTTIVAASVEPRTALRTQAAFFTDRFRVYTHDDVLGVQLGASLKNVIAIASGVCDGLGFGDNARAALVTRGLAEIARLGAAMGARPETFAGLTGMGDLIVTACSRHSRNRHFGELIARGLTVAQAQAEIGMAIEGIKTSVSAVRLAERHGVEMPISREVHAAIYEGKSPGQAARDLMLRDPKAERA